MHIEKLVGCVRRNLDELGFPGVIVRSEEQEPGAFFGVDDPLRIEPQEDGALLLVRNVTSYPDSAIERIVEHRCAAFSLRIAQGFTPVHGSSHYLLATLQERIRDAYVEHAAGKRMMAAYGQERYEEYRRASAPGLCDAVHERIRSAMLPAERFELITFFLREHAKDLLSQDRAQAPSVIGQILPAAGAVFSYVGALPSPGLADIAERADAGILRAKILSLLGSHLIEHVDVIASYDAGSVVFNDDGAPTVIDRFRPALSNDDRAHALAVERQIVGAYGMAGQPALVAKHLN